MREILFNGKRTDNGDWVEGCFIKDGKPDERKYFIQTLPTFEKPLGDIYEVDFKTIGQFVGFCDKNNQKCFTGHIVKARSSTTGKEGIYCLVFDESRFHYGFRTARHGYYYNLDELLEEELGDEISFEIIGNIHDNPELLERQ